MKNLFILLLLSTIIFACNQNDDTTLAPLPCEAENWGTVKITNQAAEAYDIYVNGVKRQSQAANTVLTMNKIPAGFYRLDMHKAGSATASYYYEATLEACKTQAVSFGK